MNETWKMNALKKLQPIFQELFLDDELKISESTSPLDIDEWDSLAHVNLLSTVEKSFGIRFTAEDMGNIENVSTLLATLAERGAN